MIKHKKDTSQPGFTIVELIICIVVIAILAGISLVSYTGMQDRARAAVLSSDLAAAAEAIGVDKVRNGNYPTTTSSVDNGRGLPASAETVYQYTANNSAEPKTFCLTGVNGKVAYYVTESDGPAEGVCTGHVAP